MQIHSGFSEIHLVRRNVISKNVCLPLAYLIAYAKKLKRSVMNVIWNMYDLKLSHSPLTAVTVF